MSGRDRLHRVVACEKRVGVDTQMIVYQFEEKPKFVELTRAFFEVCEEEMIEVVTSAVSVAEVFSNKKVLENESLVKAYTSVFEAMPGLRVLGLGIDLSKLAGGLRVKYGLRLPDAYQLAAAMKGRCGLFVTNDKHFVKVKELKVLLLKDYL